MLVGTCYWLKLQSFSFVWQREGCSRFCDSKFVLTRKCDTQRRLLNIVPGCDISVCILVCLTFSLALHFCGTFSLDLHSHLPCILSCSAFLLCILILVSFAFSLALISRLFCILSRLFSRLTSTPCAYI